MKNMRFMRYFSAILLSMTLLLSCNKEYDAESYIGEYTFSTVGRLSAYEMIIEDGRPPEIISSQASSFILETVSGNAKIFKSKGESENVVHILVEFEDGDSVVIDALVDQTNSLVLQTYSRDVTLLDVTGENVVYKGRLKLDGMGGIVDDILSLKLTICDTFDTDEKSYGLCVSDIMTVADRSYPTGAQNIL